jgi:hypothetical protein
VGGRGNALSVEFLQASELGEQIVQMMGQAVGLVVGKFEAGEVGDAFHVVTGKNGRSGHARKRSPGSEQRWGR